MPRPRFVRLAERDRRQLAFRIDGRPATALDGDTVLTAMLTVGRDLREAEFHPGTRAGFCLMGACQDLLGLDRRRGTPARLLDPAGGGHVAPDPRARRLAMTARVVIVGAGPAGIRAAEVLAGGGLHPVVIDEGERAGGQIYRRPPGNFTRPPSALYGSEVGKAVALHRLFDRMAAERRLTHRPRTSAIAVRTVLCIASAGASSASQISPPPQSR